MNRNIKYVELKSTKLSKFNKQRMCNIEYYTYKKTLHLKGYKIYNSATLIKLSTEKKKSNQLNEYQL